MENSKKYYRISQVSKMLNTPASTLRYWEKVFTQLKPLKSKNGIRYYNENDIELLKTIIFLIKEKGYTIEGAKYALKNMNTKTENLISELISIKNDLNELLRIIKE
jgi:DNA-binding transcriptional MerR regulator